jgi:hypothetical protein
VDPSEPTADETLFPEPSKALYLQAAHLYDRAAMVARSRARFLAPIALVAVIAGTYVIVHKGLTTKSPPVHHASRRGTRPRGRYRKVKYYVVQGGDSLTSIASKTGLNLSTLESLNPGVDPNSLQTGQRIRLRR